VCHFVRRIHFSLGQNKRELVSSVSRDCVNAAGIDAKHVGNSAERFTAS
jgi:hypothetical protein